MSKKPKVAEVVMSEIERRLRGGECHLVDLSELDESDLTENAVANILENAVEWLRENRESAEDFDLSPREDADDLADEFLSSAPTQQMRLVTTTYDAELQLHKDGKGWCSDRIVAVDTATGKPIDLVKLKKSLIVRKPRPKQPAPQFSPERLKEVQAHAAERGIKINDDGTCDTHHRIVSLHIDCQKGTSELHTRYRRKSIKKAS